MLRAQPAWAGHGDRREDECQQRASVQAASGTLAYLALLRGRAAAVLSTALPVAP
ncbi:hypothetical protein HPP92_006852 [Vanilla planifolia]|uniref:Uncharacterized protein n=1 Tax=Vanilla planifolia TaxID=51239 RepID=A0A835V7G7_VANPL|nr:hypothetical protein HPP92_007083 [Vanilla planifolia]KAG0489989.1 hypothetical protein HPP92_006852 [Vanilla planifolia]